jgi:Porin subfamily
VVAVGAAPTTSRAGMLFPDPYAAFRMSQAWGNFSAAIHASQNAALYYTGNNAVLGLTGCGAGAQGGTTQCLYPSDKMGWALLSGGQINLPWIAQGDRVLGFFNYGQGATKYAGGANLNSAGLFGSGNNVALGVATDGVYVNGAGIQLTTGWAFGAAFEHWITPQFDVVVYGSRGEFKYNNTVIAGRYFCGGSGAAVQNIVVAATTVCDPGFTYSEVGLRFDWYPVPAFRLAIEGRYAMIDTAFAGQVTLTKTQGARPTGAYTAKDQGISQVAFRAQRGFGGIGE